MTSALKIGRANTRIHHVCSSNEYSSFVRYSRFKCESQSVLESLVAIPKADPFGPSLERMLTTGWMIRRSSSTVCPRLCSMFCSDLFRCHNLILYSLYTLMHPHACTGVLSMTLAVGQQSKSVLAKWSLAYFVGPVWLDQVVFLPFGFVSQAAARALSSTWSS